jgi:hypothetical protein
MPIPIRLNKSLENQDGKCSVDYSFLLQQMAPVEERQKIIIAGNKDASLLFEIWCNASKTDGDTFKIDTSKVDSQNIIRLKANGFITGGLETLKFTEKGKKIITTMALGETSRFAKDADKQKSYSEILASMDKRGKKGYRIPKYASNTSNFLRLG